MQEPGRGGGLRNQATRSSQTRQPSVASLVTSLTSRGICKTWRDFVFSFSSLIALLFYLIYYGFCVCRWISKRGKSRPGAILSRAGTREGYWAGTSFLSFLFLETWVHSTCVSRIANPEFFGTGRPAGWVSLYADSLFFSAALITPRISSLTEQLWILPSLFIFLPLFFPKSSSSFFLLLSGSLLFVCYQLCLDPIRICQDYLFQVYQVFIPKRSSPPRCDTAEAVTQCTDWEGTK